MRTFSVQDLRTQSKSIGRLHNGDEVYLMCSLNTYGYAITNKFYDLVYMDDYEKNEKCTIEAADVGDSLCVNYAPQSELPVPISSEEEYFQGSCYLDSTELVGHMLLTEMRARGIDKFLTFKYNANIEEICNFYDSILECLYNMLRNDSAPNFSSPIDRPEY